MKIEWLGMSSFKIELKTEASEKTILLDPFDPKIVGKKSPRGSFDMIISSTPVPLEEKGEIITIYGEGEYEHSGVFVYGFAQYKKIDNTLKKKYIVYRIESDGMSIVHLGALGMPLNADILERLEKVDILLLPIGGGEVLSSGDAANLVNEIEPRVVIPMYYRIPGLSPEVEKTLEPKDAFLKIFRVHETVGTKFKVQRKDLPEEKTKIIIIDPS